MSDVKALLEQATPLPWKGGRFLHEYGYGYFHEPVSPAQGRGITGPDAALIVYAVNALPAYVAAVEALERLTSAIEANRSAARQGITDNGSAVAAFEAGVPALDDAFEMLYAAEQAAAAALAALRESEAANV